MNALYVICGLGVASLVAELLHLKKWLIPFFSFGDCCCYCGGGEELEYEMCPTSMEWWSWTTLRFAFSTLICVIAFFWFLDGQ